MRAKRGCILGVLGAWKILRVEVDVTPVGLVGEAVKWGECWWKILAQY
jgi:hypothetical protein